MNKKWTVEQAKAFISTVEKKKLPKGLTYWSAKDFLNKVGVK